MTRQEAIEWITDDLFGGEMWHAGSAEDIAEALLAIRALVPNDQVAKDLVEEIVVATKNEYGA